MSSAADDEPARPAAGEITALLERWRNGERDAVDALVPLVYDELKRLARAYLRRSSGQPTLQPTELVHELMVKLLGRPAVDVRDRHHFFALAARVLRQVLVDQARARAADKRGGGACFVDVTQAEMAAAPAALDLLDLDRALDALRARDPQLERLVELRFFAGLTVEESALVLERSPASISRDWVVARAVLLRELALR